MSEYNFKYASPESVEVSSKCIENFIKRLKKQKLDMHSVLILKDDKLICETYAEPFHRNTLHRMFSAAKSFVSIAIGILSDRGIISLDDSITKYFPEYEPLGGFYEYTKETTIRDMLKMTTPHNGTTFDKNNLGDWTESYFTKKPTHRSGTIFSYDTSASHVLTALVEKLTKKSLLDFLRECGLKELGFSDEAYFITDGAGVSQGGSGLMARPIDLMIFAQVVKDGGRGIVSKEYIKEATSYQVATFHKGSFLEECMGYGYQFWRVRNNGFMMYGMAGQIALILPDEDMILVTTADLTERKDGMQLVFEAFWDEIYDNLGNAVNDVNDEAYQRQLDLMPLENKIYKTYNEKFEFSDQNPLMLKSLEIKCDKTGGKVLLCRLDGEKQKIEFGFGEFKSGVFNKYSCAYIACGQWIDNDTLIIKANLIGECIGKVIMQFSFKKDGYVTVFSRKTEQVLFSEYAGFAQSNKIDVEK